MALSLISMGMISSLGGNVTSACAAIRAGVAMPRELAHFQVLDEEDGVGVPLKGHPVRGYAEGFTSLGRWMRLAQGAFEDLLEHGGLPDLADPFWQHVELIVITPPLVASRLVEAGSDPAALRSSFIEQIALHLELPLRTDGALVLDRGSSGIALALQLAEKRASLMVQRFLVIAVDSHVDAEALDWLAATGRLKSPANPCGLSPGEAAVCLLVEPAAARRAGARAVLKSWAVDREPEHFLAGKVSAGDALARAIRGALRSAAPQGPFAGDIIVDLNGENWRAREWAQAQIRLSDVLDPGARLIVPAASTGDIGAAAGAAAICVAACSFARSYAAQDHALVAMSSEHGDVGAVVIAAAS